MIQYYVFSNIFNFLVSAYDFFIPYIAGFSDPAVVLEYTNKVVEYLFDFSGLLYNYFDIDYLLILFLAVFALEVFLFTYHLIMWVVRKVPLSIE